MTPTDPEFQHLLAAAHFLRDGAESLTFNDFYSALNRTIGCDKGYARNVYGLFQNNPAAFLASRNPQSQSEELIRVMMARLEAQAKAEHSHSQSTATPTL